MKTQPTDVDPVKKLEGYKFAEIKNTGGYKKRIVTLFFNSELADKCGLTDFLGRLQFILDEYAVKPQQPTDEEIQIAIEQMRCPDTGQPMMDEQTFYEGAKWMRDQLTK